MSLQAILDLGSKYRADHPDCTHQEMYDYLYETVVEQGEPLMKLCVDHACGSAMYEVMNVDFLDEFELVRKE